MDTTDRKRVLITVDEANKALKDGQVALEWDNTLIVITDEDIPNEDDCCFRSHTTDYDNQSQSEKCSECGRIFDINRNLQKFNSLYVKDDILAYVPKKEFL